MSDSLAAREIVVLGARGFVGTWLMRELAARTPPATLRAVDRDELDITDARAVERFIGARRPAAVVNLAAIASPVEAQRDPQAAWAVNYEGAANVARAVVAHSPATRLVQVGSATAYGRSFDIQGGELDETAPLAPNGTYAETKAAADQLIAALGSEGLRAVRFRPFWHAGPGQAPIYAAASFARQLALISRGRQEPVIRVGDLAPRRDFLDARDVARAYADAALGDGFPAGEAINLASGTPVPIGDILERLIRLSGASVRVEVDPDLLRRNETPCAAGSNARAARLLGWRPRIALEQTLADVMADWLVRIDRLAA